MLTPSEYEDAYLVSGDAPKGSGCNSGPDGWEIGRRPIADAVHRAGTFLDIGCANGLLMELIVGWARHPVEPYGLDFAPRLVELACARLPHWADRIFLGDALEWQPPRRFDFVRTELVYATPDRERELAERVLGWLEPGGRLIVCGYGDPVRARVRTWGFEPEFELEWRSATGRLNELAAIGVRRPDWKASTSWLRRRTPRHEIKDVAHQIRLGGNLGAYPDRDGLRDVQRPDAEAILRFLRDFLRYVYEFPRALTASRKRHRETSSCP